jgi:fumarylacetoacetate (FAA) hydrolase
MKVGLGPAKGKDFATSLGPYLVSKEDLHSCKTGNRYDLTMTAAVNGKEISKGNLKDIYYPFSEMIERASSGVTLYPGEVIGSGTVGTGCILELGEEVHRYLRPGDEIELTIEGLGLLKNKIAAKSR